MPLDHIAFAAPASKFDACVAFYVAALAPLGYKKLKDFGKFVGLGVSEKPDFWLAEKEGAAETQQTHIAFTAKDHAEVKAVYDAALATGAKGNGEPGPRPQYHPHFFGAYMFDPLGNNFEVVCHTPQA